MTWVLPHSRLIISKLFWNWVWFLISRIIIFDLSSASFMIDDFETDQVSLIFPDKSNNYFWLEFCLKHDWSFCFSLTTVIPLQNSKSDYRGYLHKSKTKDRFKLRYDTIVTFNEFKIWLLRLFFSDHDNCIFTYECKKAKQRIDLNCNTIVTFDKYVQCFILRYDHDFWRIRQKQKWHLTV